MHECVDAYMQAGMALLQGHKGLVYCNAISDDSKLIASGGGGGEMKIWDICTSQCMHSFEGHGGGEVYSVDFSKDGKWLVSGGDDNDITLWSLNGAETPTVLRTLTGHSRCVNCVEV